MQELSARRQRILRHIVEEYVTTAQPVSSELIARKYEPDVSPATVRNEMASLERAGLIAQPHTSAGRLPTDQGYRLYVERLMQPAGSPPSEERRQILHRFQQVGGDPGESAHLASSLLARSVGSAAVAMPPSSRRPRLRRVELVPLEENLALVTVILQSGAVRQAIHRLETPVERTDLARLSNELSDVLANKTAGQARRSLGRFAEDRRPFVDIVLRLLTQAEQQSSGSIYYEGLAQLLAQPEFQYSEKLRPILEVLEQQPLLTRFLAESLASPGLQVVIGTENRLEQMRESAVVLTRYGSEDEGGGVLGVLGPTRLPYWRAVTMVRFMADLMDLLVQQGRERTQR